MTDVATNKKSGAIKSETLAELGRGQWVRDRILDARPDLRAEFKDYDGDGTVGDIDDFVRYYEMNSVDIERDIPFFKWVAKMDPHRRSIYNPIHDYLSLAYDVVPASDIKGTYELMGSVIADVRQLHGASPAKKIVTLLQQEFASVQKGSLLLLGAAYQFGLVEEADGILSVPRADGSFKDMTLDELYGDFYADHADTSDKNGDLERAHSHYADSIDLDPSYQSRYHRLSTVLHDMEKYKEAIGVCEDALKRDPYDAKAMARRGAAYLALKNIRAARADFRGALQFDSTNAPAHIGLGRIQHLKKNYKGAREHYTDATKADPTNALGYYWRAVAYDDEGMPKKAITDFIRAIKRDRSFGDAFYGLALAQWDAGYYGYAYRNLMAAMRRDPSNASIYKDLGLLQQERKKLKSAMWAFNKALELKPKLVSALIGRGNLWRSQNEYLNALADYEKALKVLADSEKALAVVDSKDIKSKADVYRNMGFLYMDMSMPKLAYKSFLSVAALDPNNPRAWCELGEILSKPEFLSKPEYRIKLAKAVGTNLNLAALKAFTEAKKLDKKYVKAYHGIAMAWFRQGKYEKALEILNKCLDVDRHNADTLYMRSEVKGKLGDYEGARKDRDVACNRLKSRLCERK